ncbi:MAG: Hsp70 family protein [Actinomycetia bacterium]|nr:Hsp70 family protein [Actinomycetes bacterium]
MGYELGVDLGTTYTAAATHRDGSVQIVELGNRSATIPSVVFLTEDGAILTGEAANRRAMSAPGRVAREFKRRIGDPTPVLIGGSPVSAESLSARLLEWVIGWVTDREGEPPSRVAVTHPANWGPYKLDLLHQAFRMANLEQVVTLREPEAAAIHYSTLERIDPGTTIGVFDLGGGTFDAAILRKKAEGFDFLGEPEGIERLGGIDFDAAVFAFVGLALGQTIEQLDPTDPAASVAVARLRRDCVEAKEALSGDTEVTISVALPGVHTDIRLTRIEFEQMVRPSLADAIGAMERAVRGASLTLDEIDLILLVGGSSRIPLVGQMVGGELGRPVAVDAHPKHSVALGAAWAAAPSRVGHLASATMLASAESLAAAAAAKVGTPTGAGPAADTDAPGQFRASDQTTATPATGQPFQPVTSQPTPLVAAASDTGQPMEPVTGQPASPAHPGPDAGQPAVAQQPEPATGQPAAFPVTGPDAGADSPSTGPGGYHPGGVPGAESGGAGASAAEHKIPGAATYSDTGREVPMASASGNQGGSRLPLLVGIGVVIALLLIGGVALAQLGGDDEVATGLADSDAIDTDSTDGTGTDDGDAGTSTTADESTTTTAKSTTTYETTTTTEAPFVCAGLCAHVEDVQVLDNGELLIDWTAFNYEPSNSNFHAHFFYNTYEPEQVGTNANEFGVEQGSWQLTDQIPFDTTGTKASVANAPAGATQICVVAADSGHGVVNPENFECFDLP